MKRITADDPTGYKILRLIRHKIGLYCAHTNIDTAEGGINDILFDSLGLTGKEPLMESGLGKVGVLNQDLTLKEFTEYVKSTLSLPEIRFAGKPDARIHKVGLCAGDAAHQRYWQAALEKNCQVYITGDLRYHGSVEAVERGINLIDITHYMGEAPVVKAIVDRLAKEAANARVDLTITPMIEKNVLTIT
jgi:dinuclear metal center YbgI/SA1388 family protein